MDKFWFSAILDEFSDKFYGLQELAEELRVALFPIQQGGLFMRTLIDSNKLYKSMIDALNNAIGNLGTEMELGKPALLISPISA